MTHRERAVAATATIMAGDYGDMTAETFIAEVIWLACVEGCNDELARRREMEQTRDRAIRIQSALEDRNARLEEWLNQLDSLLAPDDELRLAAIAAARAALNESACEAGTI